MHRLRHIGVSLLWIGISLLASGTGSALGSQSLESFTATYQLNRGRMIIGKVTTRLQLGTDGSYTYSSVTIPVGIVAVFSKGQITETSKGRISGRQVIPSSYRYHHKRKKRPKLRRLQFDWPANRVTAPGTSPVWSSSINTGTQDKASKILSMMLAMRPGTADMQIRVADKTKLKTYRISRVKQEQIDTADRSFDTIQLNETKPGKPPSTRFWLAPELHYLPVKIEKKEKNDTFTMTLVKFSR
jgi:hypothetical protein